jgi:Uma2 family endonuclease
MTAGYEEIIDGEVLRRAAPGERHEAICARLHAAVTASLAGVRTARLLAPRSIVQLSAGTLLRPDLALVTTATGKLWLAAEIVQAGDHQPDTVLKKQVYEDLRSPRLWMIDPRYNNVEVYHSGEYGLALRQILAARETLTEELLPGLKLAMNDLFAA